MHNGVGVGAGGVGAVGVGDVAEPTAGPERDAERQCDGALRGPFLLPASHGRVCGFFDLKPVRALDPGTGWYWEVVESREVVARGFAKTHRKSHDQRGANGSLSGGSQPKAFVLPPPNAHADSNIFEW